MKERGTEGRTEGRKDRRTEGQKDGRTEGQKDGRKDGSKNIKEGKKRKDGRKDSKERYQRPTPALSEGRHRRERKALVLSKKERCC